MADRFGWVHPLFDLSLYKPNQGRKARQFTALGIALIVLTGLWKLHVRLMGWYWHRVPMDIVIPLILFAVAVWVTFRVLNIPRFADFLIVTEGEMNKVSWASWDELIRATVVVIVCFVLLGLFLFLMDAFWDWLLHTIGVLH